MKVTLTIPQEYDVKYLRVDAGVRYWEDAEVNGVEDNDDNPTIYGVEKDRWKITIDLEQGLILGWPSNMTASVHYKVCDDGTYSLLDDKMQTIVEKDCYVPDLLCVDDAGYGDYIIFNVDEDGLIKNWNNRDIQSLIDEFIETEGF